MRTLLRRTTLCGLLVAAAAAAAVNAGAAFASFTSTGTATGTAAVGTMRSPDSPQATAGAGTVDLSWPSDPPPASGPVSYYVSRDGTPVGGSCGTPTSPISDTSCTDRGLRKGTYSYTVTAVWRSWTATSSPIPASLSSGAAAQIVLSGSADDLASGSTRQLTATVEDSDGNTVSVGPDSGISISVEQVGGSGSVSGTGSAAASAGVATKPVTGEQAGIVIITALGTLSGPESTTSNTLGFTVVTGAADATRSTLSPTSSSITADGTATQVLTVQAKDAHGNDETTGDATVTITKQSGTGTIGPVTDNGNGTYTATATAPTATGSGVFVATLDGNPVKSGSATQTQATVDYVPGPAVGIALSSETVAPSPDVACSGSVGSITCSSYDEPNTSGKTLTARFSPVDQFGNPVGNTGPDIGIDLGMSGDGSVDPSGAGALTIPTGASATSSSFTAVRQNGNNKTLTVTATVHGTSQMLTIVLSSGNPPGAGVALAPANTDGSSQPARPDTSATSTSDTAPYDSPASATDTTGTDTTSTDEATGSVASRSAVSEGLSTMREVLFFAVLGASVLGVVGLLTMPIPRRRRARRRREA